jgi:RNA polymerase-binding transcription factor DksA
MGLTKKDVQKFKAVLLAKRMALIGDATHIQEEAMRKGKDDAATLDISNFADLGSDNYEQEFDLSVLESQGHTVLEIDEALERIENGTFGICEECGCVLRKGRLAAMPHARLCVRCASKVEEGGV